MFANEDKLLREFFYKPMSHFGVRELSRTTRLDTKTVMKYLRDFTERKILLKQCKKWSFPYFEANRLSHTYLFNKSHLLVKRIIESGLVDFLENKLQPTSIVLFGSVPRGVYHAESDIDLFIQTSYVRLDLSKFEKFLGHKIQILFEENLNSLSKGLLENIYNGEVLSGRLEVVKK